MKNPIPLDRATALAAAVFVAAALTLAGPVAPHPSTRMTGNTISDSAGVARYLWVLEQQHRNPFNNRRDGYTGAPEGVPISTALEYAQPLQPIVLWGTQAVWDRVAAINLFAFGGLLISAFAFFFTGRWIGFSGAGALIPAFVVPFGPWSTEQLLAGHIAFLHTWPLALLLGSLALTAIRRTASAAIVVGLAGAACIFTAAYLGMVALPIAACGLLVLVVSSRSVADRLWTATLTCIAVGTMGVLLIPALYAYLTDLQVTRQVAGHGANEASSYAASLLDYLTPGPHLAILGYISPDASSNASFGGAESIVFFGYSVLSLSLVGIWIVLRRRDVPTDNGVRFTVVTAAAVLPLAILLSLPPHVAVLGLRIPLPSALLTHVTTFYRVYARFALAAAIAATLLAALAVDTIRHRAPRVAWALIALVLLELWPGRLPTWETGSRPIDRWLRQEPSGIVADYPQITDQPAGVALAFQAQAYQPENGHRLYTLVSSGTGDTREQAIRIVSRYLDDPNTIPVLAAEGVRYVVLHTDVYRAEGAEVPAIPSALRFLKKVGAARIYELRSNTQRADLDSLLEQQAGAIAAVQGLKAPTALYSGFGAARQENGQTWRELRGRAAVYLDNTDARVHRIELGVASASAGQQTKLTIESPAGVTDLDVGPAPAQTLIGPFDVPAGRTVITITRSSGAPALVGELAIEPLADFSVSLR